jgi:hypothetical protein
VLARLPVRPARGERLGTGHQGRVQLTRGDRGRRGTDEQVRGRTADLGVDLVARRGPEALGEAADGRVVVPGVGPDDLDRVEPLDGQPRVAGGLARHGLPEIERLRAGLLANRALGDANETGGARVHDPS